jgi:hypothetical protein
VHSRKAILAFCHLAHRTVWCTTGHCPVRISFLIWRSQPLQSWSRWRTRHCPVHTGQSGAHRTVRCPFRPLALATRRARIPRPTVGSADCWLTGQSGAPPDSPVIYSRTPPSKSREQLVRRCQPGAPDSPVHPDRAAFWLYLANFSPKQFLLFLALRHNTLVFKSMYQV